MSERDKSNSWGLVFRVILLITLLPPIVYVAGYPLLGPNESLTPSTIDREFPHPLFTRIYIPMGIAESQLRGKPVVLVSDDAVGSQLIYFEP